MNNFELQILDMIQGWRTPLGDVIMPIITKFGDDGIFWICLALVLLIIPKTRKLGAVVAISLAMEFLLCNGIIKPLVARVRPYDLNPAVELLASKPHDYSFPSGHSSAAFASSCALLFAGNRTLGIPALVLSILIAFSRLYLYMHYPTDVIGGAALGILCGYVGNWLVSKLIERRNRKLSDNGAF